MYNDKIKEIVLATLVADSYSLGAHWVYDEKQLATLPINWEELNVPQAIWHKGKQKGDFTHYGDKTLWLYEFLKTKKSFDKKEFQSYLAQKIKTYNGYMDGASRESLPLLEAGKDEGSTSDDFSVVGQIPALLLVSNSDEEFLKNVQAYIKLTHNSKESLEAGEFFANLLLLGFQGNDIEKNIDILCQKAPNTIQTFISSAKKSLDKKSFEAIREFGPACSTNEAFKGTIYLLLHFKSLKELLIQNARSGGDSSARGMVATMIYVATYKNHDLPKTWFDFRTKID